MVFRLFLAAAVLPLCFTSPATAECLMATSGASCAVAGPSYERVTPLDRLRDSYARGPELAPGTQLPRGKYNVLLLSDYYGLPPVRDGWVYMDVARNIYRVDFRSYRIIDMVTDQTAANW